MAAPEGPRGGPTGEVRGFSLVEYDTGGAVVWILTADRAVEAVDEVTVEGIRLEVHGGGGASPTVVTAPRGAFDRRTRNVSLEGGIEVRLADGGRVISDRVDWVAEARALRAPAPVKFERGGTWAEADEVEIDPRARLLKSRGARGLVQLGE